MSNDLIKRRDTIENIWSLFNNTYNDATRFDAEETELAKRILSDVQTVIDEQPTAYDVDKVLERLEDAHIDCFITGYYKYNRAIDESIKIVKAGIQEKRRII